MGGACSTDGKDEKRTKFNLENLPSLSLLMVSVSPDKMDFFYIHLVPVAARSKT
jgi:hypothetical protein